MPTIDQAVDFLRSYNALQEGESPWSDVYREDLEYHRVDWTRIFPRSRPFRENYISFDDDWNPEFSEEELSDLNHALDRDWSRLLAQDEKSSIWDTCAWYQPVHYFGRNWGIFIKEDCIHHLAMKIVPFLPDRMKLNRSHIALNNIMKTIWRTALYLFFLHEHYHHKIECLAFRLHVIERKGIYIPYHQMVYLPSFGTDKALEEALANADMYHRLVSKPYIGWITHDVAFATRRFLELYFPCNPPGYRMAINYLKDAAFDTGENLLQAQVKELTLHPSQPIDEWELAPRMTQSFFRIDSNIWTVLPRGKSSKLPII